MKNFLGFAEYEIVKPYQRGIRRLRPIQITLCKYMVRDTFKNILVFLWNSDNSVRYFRTKIRGGKKPEN